MADPKRDALTSQGAPAPLDAAQATRLAELETTRVVLAGAGLALPPEIQRELDELLRHRAAVTSAVAHDGLASRTIVQTQTGGTVVNEVYGDVHTGDEHHHHYPPGDARAAEKRAALETYFRWVVWRCKRISTRSIEPEQNDAENDEKAPELARVYVALDTTSLVPESEAGPALEGRPRRRSVVEMFACEQKLVLLGHPGYGKSTVLNYTALCLAENGLSPVGGSASEIAALDKQASGLVPVPVILRELATAAVPSKKVTAKWIEDFVTSQIEEDGYRAGVGVLPSVLADGRAIVLLDGLDEVSKELRAGVRSGIVALAQRYPGCRYVVTCRMLTYLEDKPEWPFAHAEIAPLDDDKTKQFIHGWYRELSRVRRASLPEAEATRLAEKLEAAVRASVDLREMAQSPLLLTVMAVVHATLGELPEAEARLYREALNILLWRWGQVKGHSPKDLLDQVKKEEIDLLVALRRLAFEVHERGPTERGAAADIPERDLVAAFQRIDPRRSEAWAEEMLAAVKHRAGLLIPAGENSYRFPHRTYQELLAGWHLVHLPDFVKQASRRVRDDATRWRKPVLLGIGLLLREGGNLSSVPLLLAELCPLRGGSDETAWRTMWRAGEVVLEVGPDRLIDTELGGELVERVRTRLLALVEGGKLVPRERIEAGRLLGRIGDPRFDPGLWHLPAGETLGFVRIPGGQFRMGSDKKHDALAYDDEMPRHVVDVPEVWLGRYPVTVAQWRAYVRATSYTPAEPEGLRGVDNEPVRDVTWDDAREYVTWLDGVLRGSAVTPPSIREVLSRGYSVRLPSEAEWEKGARGTEGRIWPWGNDFGEGRANTVETRLGDVSPVGSFPGGATPEGIDDMAGNVWEWTRSVERKYHYLANDGRQSTNKQKPRSVLRGGSYGNDRRLVRCAFRSGGGPLDVWSGNVGFRLALAPR